MVDTRTVNNINKD